MNLAFGCCRVPTCYHTPLAGMLASVLIRLLAAGLATRHSQVWTNTPAGMGLESPR